MDLRSTSLTKNEVDDFNLLEIKIDTAGLDLPHQPRPTADKQLLHGELPEDDHPQIYMTRSALQQVYTHAMSNTRVELGGVLLGRVVQDNGQMIVHVEAALPAQSDENGPVHFTFTHAAWSNIHADRSIAFPDLDIVGWFHTHPDLGVFYSADDEIVHSAAFTQPWHVGLVVDPIRNHVSYFGWVKDHLLQPLPGFFELHEGQHISAVPWHNKVDNSWLAPLISSYGDVVATGNYNLMIKLSLFFSSTAAVTGITALILVLMRRPSY